ncbi:MAG TPA: AI-2E family transporter, partial [Daejeonella sp.]|nr:AI-2E family transporter [Daejeonella sp.]
MQKLQHSVYVLLLLFLAFSGLYFAREFLIPLTLAAVLAMLFVRFSNYLESKGLKRGWSALVCVLLLVILVIGAFTLLSFQLSNLADNMDGIKKRLLDMVDQVKVWIQQTFNISYQKQKELLENQSKGSSGQISSFAGSFMGIIVNS